MKKAIIPIIAIIAATICLSACKISPNKTELTEYEKEILNYYNEPSIDEEFSDDRLLVILKNAYSNKESVSFSDFKIKDSNKIAYISNLTEKTIYAGTNDRLPLNNMNNQILKFGLNVHSKEVVLELIGQLNALDIVLVAEPDYITEGVDDWLTIESTI